MAAGAKRCRFGGWGRCWSFGAVSSLLQRRLRWRRVLRGRLRRWRSSFCGGELMMVSIEFVAAAAVMRPSLWRRRRPWFWVNCREIFRERDWVLLWRDFLSWVGVVVRLFFWGSGGYLFCYFAIIVYDYMTGTFSFYFICAGCAPFLSVFYF